MLEDSSICKSKTAHDALAELPYLAPKTNQYISKMNNKALANVLQKVLTWDIQYSKRPDPKWVCYCGLDVMTGDGNPKFLTLTDFENGKKKQRQELAEYIETLRNN